MNRSQFKSAYQCARAKKTPFVVGYATAQKCLAWRQNYHHIDLYNTSLCGVYKRHVYSPKGSLPE